MLMPFLNREDVFYLVLSILSQSRLCCVAREQSLKGVGLVNEKGAGKS